MYKCLFGHNFAETNYDQYKMKTKVTTLLALAQIGTMAMAAEPNERPNVLFILIDDFGWMDVGYNGSTFYETPNLDRLADEFMQFNRCYTPSPMSSPTRASIMLGQNPARHGITQWLPGLATWPGNDISKQAVLCNCPKVQALPCEEVTLGEKLQNAGYETAFFGKWHMGSFSETGGPEAHGFDESCAVIEENSCAMSYPFKEIKEGMEMPDKAFYFPDANKDDNFTDLLSEQAIEYIQRDRDKPFFLYLAQFAMHHPIKSKEEIKVQFEDKKARTMEEHTKEESIISDDPYAHKPYNKYQNSSEYAGELYTLDDNIGRIIQAVKDAGLYDNTIIIITGDNGGRSTICWFDEPTSVQPLRGGKTFTFDGGLRTPLLIHNPKVECEGKKCDQMVTSMDFYPTILDIAELPLDMKQHSDGVSLVPLFEGGKLKDRSLYFHFPHYQGEGGFPTSAIYQDGYKLIYNYQFDDMLLYDIFNDPYEKNNLLNEESKRATKMKKDLFKYLNEVNADIPQLNPQFKN